MNDLLPPRLPEPRLVPPAGGVPQLMARAKARRRRRIESALCVPLVAGLAIGGLDALDHGQGPSEIRTVDPATERGIDDVVRDITGGHPGVPAVAGGPAGPARQRAAGEDPEPDEEPGDPGAEDEDPDYAAREPRYVTTDRAIVADRPLEPCTVQAAEEERVPWCVRNLSPAEAPAGSPVDLVAEYCPRTGRDEAMDFLNSQEIVVWLSSDSDHWVSIERVRETPHRLEIPAGSCARWTVHWDGRDMIDGRPLPEGEYRVTWASLRHVDGQQPGWVQAGALPWTIRLT